MQNSILSRRYAKAIFDLVIENKSATKVSEDFVAIQKMLQESDTLQEVIQNPVISKKEQHSAISFILKRLNATDLVVRFISVLIDNGRLSILPEAIFSYFEMERKRKGEVTANVISAKFLSAKQIKDIEKSLGEELNKKVKIKPQIDEDILGGVIVKIGSKMLDASISGKLNKLQILSKQAIAS